MPGQPVVLETLGGIVATSRPEDLPEGASPRNNDVDFIASRIVQRPGASSVYTLTSSAYGPRGGGFAESIGSAAPWINPDNILLDDGSFTSLSLAGLEEVVSIDVEPGVPSSGFVLIYPTTHTDEQHADGTASSSLSGGSVAVWGDPTNWSGIAKMGWGDFMWPTLPAGAVVTAIRNVITMDYSLSGHTAIFANINIPIPPLPAYFTGTVMSASFGTLPTYVTSNFPNIYMAASVPFPPPFSDFFHITAIAMRIDYDLPAPTTGGYYALSETPIATLSGPGAGGATATANTTTISGTYKVVSSVTVTAGGSYTGPATVLFTGAANPANDATGLVHMGPLGQNSDNLLVDDFAFSIPASYVIRGIKVGIKGYSTDAVLHFRMVKGGSMVGDQIDYPLPTVNAFTYFGGPTSLFGTTWTPAEINDSTFGIELWVDSPSLADVFLDFASITIYGDSAPGRYLGIVNANLDQTDQTTLVLDENGLTWQEDVTNNEGTLFLETLIPVATPGSYLKGLDANGVAYMAYSDLTEGISQPMQFNGRWSDRITQVGPGAAPQFTPQQSTSDTFSISTIDQPTQAMYGFVYYLQSTGPGSTAPGNVVTLYYGDSTQPNPLNLDLQAAMATGYPVYIYLGVAGIPTPFGPLTVQVTSIGLQSPPSQPRQFYFLTFQVTNSAFVYYQGSGHAGYIATWTRTLATMVMTDPVPGLEIGNIVTIAANTQAGYNSTWPIAQTLDSGAFGITGTQVTAGVATYNYTLQSGVAPAAGELVTITNTNNADGALNLVNATVASSTGGGTGSFTVAVPIATDFAFAVESGQATTAGTTFAFDPGFPVLGTGTSPIFGAGTGGTLTFEGAASQLITEGVKQGTCFFITRNGAPTRLAPPVNFHIPSNCGAILATQIPVGPPNVVARGIVFTESGQNGVAGANFYTYDTPVSFIVNGITYTSTALIVPDNTSTSWKFSFSDSVLLASDEIDLPGNNYFNLIELGNPTWLFQYANRMLYGLCETKLQNLLNMSFDGGYLPTHSSALPMPTGWIPDGTGNTGSYHITAFSITSNVATFTATNSLVAGYSIVISGLTTGTYFNGGTFIVASATSTHFTIDFTHADVGATSDSGTAAVTDSSIGVVQSLDFGNAFLMSNLGATAWTDETVLFQYAFEDAYDAPIIEPNVPYSVRVKARSIAADAQTMIVQFPSYTNGVFSTDNFGQAIFTFDRGGYVIKTAPIILGGGLTTVNPNIVLAFGVQALAVGAGIEVDRIEIFPTNRPADNTTIWTSYAGKFESVDEVTGQLGVGAENPQPATGAFDILEQLYIEKTKSLQVTQDSPNYEPNNWQVRQASDRAGACGPNAFDEGEEFAISANRSGLYYFDGGKPMPISRELQSTAYNLNLWESIVWNVGETIWVRNDLVNHRLLVGIPMTTPNPWLPNADPLTPLSPNVILMCNYSGCATGNELADASEVHVTMFGDLKALDMRRKWSLWQIASPAAEFVPRADGFSYPLFLCNGNESGKIYQLLNGAVVGGQNTDDGAPINWQYVTSPFMKAKAGQQVPGIGALRKVWYYMTATMEGTGRVAGKLYSNSLGALTRNTFTIPLPYTLTYPQQNDQERVLEIGGQRVFVEFSSIGTGGYAEIGPVILDGEVDKNAPHRGVSS